jgi:FkbM family methyltransferase
MIKEIYRKSVLQLIKKVVHLGRRARLFNRFVGLQVCNFRYKRYCFKILLNSKNGYLDEEIFLNGVFEPEILDLIHKHSDNKGTFVDIGANIGQHSLFASQFFKKVIAFEPINRLATQLSNSAKINEFNNIHVYYFGCSNKNHRQTIYQHDINIGESSLINNNHKYCEEISLVKFDYYIKEKIDLVKIDVEGYEYYALLGMKQALKKYKPTIIMEYSPFLYHKQDPKMAKKLYNFLYKLGYTFRNAHTKELYYDFTELPNHQTNLILEQKQ